MAKEPKKQAVNASKKSVLIVEDSIDFSNLLKYVVDDLGYEGIQYPLEQEDMVGWVRENMPSLVLMDLALRRKNGMEYIEDLKGDPATKHLPIIIISGRDINQKEVLALQLRDVKYLRKGRVEMDELKRTITATLQKVPPLAVQTKKV